MIDEPSPEDHKEDANGQSAEPHVSGADRGQKAYQRAQKAYEATNRLGKRLRETVGRLTTSEWITAVFTVVIAAGTVWNVVVVKSSLSILQGQLDEMKATREGSDKSFGDQLAVMRDQASAMRGQLNQMTATRRPWIAVDDFTITGIEIFPAGAGVIVDSRFKMVNLGQSPAVNVFISTALIFSGSEDFSSAIAKRICRPRPKGEDDLLDSYKSIVLPGESVELKSFHGAPSLAAAFSHSIEKPDGRTREDVEANFILAGCITYQVLGDSESHRTGFAYKATSLDLKDPDYKRVLKIPTDKGVVKDVVLTSVPFQAGNFAD